MSEPRHSQYPFEAKCAYIPQRCPNTRPRSMRNVTTAGHRSRRARKSKSPSTVPDCTGLAPATLIRTRATRRSRRRFAAGPGRGRAPARERPCSTTLPGEAMMRSRSRSNSGRRAAFVRSRCPARSISRARAGESLARSDPMSAIDPVSCRRSRTRHSMRVRSSRPVCTANASPRCMRAFRSIASAPDGYACSCRSGCVGSDDRLRRASRAPCRVHYR